MQERAENNLDKKQKPKINDPSLRMLISGEEEGRNRASRCVDNVTREIERVCEREFKFVFCAKPSEKEKNHRRDI